MTVDLHVHTTFSDGHLTPPQIVALAVKRGVTVIGITDHDTIDGIAPSIQAAHQFPHLTIIPGIEINTDVPKGEVHILGYFIDYTDKKLIDNLDALRDSRAGRAAKMIDKLRSLGCPLDLQNIEKLAQGAPICRPHIAQAMIDAGYVTSMKEVFDTYIGHDCPAYIERKRLLPEEAVRLIADAHGLPVLAHPADIEGLETLIPALKKSGLIGIEVYYKNYTRDTINKLLSFCRSYGLIATGGTDYHGFGDADEVMLGGTPVPQESAKRLLALANQH